MIKLRVARGEDAEGILAIFAPYVGEANVTFDYEVDEAEIFCRQIEELLDEYPWLVAEDDGKVIGYAYAKQHRERTAYQWCAESTVFFHQDYQGQGIAKELYEALLQVLTKQNYINLYAGIAQPNEGSTMFHVKMGFTPVGVYKKVGFKNDQWYDVLWVHRILVKHPTPPQPVVKFSDPAIQTATLEILKAKEIIINSQEG